LDKDRILLLGARSELTRLAAALAVDVVEFRATHRGTGRRRLQVFAINLFKRGRERFPPIAARTRNDDYGD
jgi:hypothetical protein